MNMQCIKESSSLSRPVTMPLSEDDILELHHIFTTVGIQNIKAENVAEGRRIVHDILHSLQWYHDIAYISDSTKTSLYGDAKNLYPELDRYTMEEQLSEFFVSQFQYDFLCIEATPTLVQKKWLPLFERQLKEFHIDLMIPVLVIQYETYFTQ